jgi:Tfp pilus assembly PilM family ATPase
MGVGDMASIGAFLYNDDTHELDSEIGYGKQASRLELNAASDDLLVYMTSQANPFQSIKNKIKREQWCTLSIKLTLEAKNRCFAT